MLSVKMTRILYMPLLLLGFCGFFEILAYQIPELSFEKTREGFRISIPAENGVKNVAFNVNRNRPFSTFEQGDFSNEIHSSTNGRFEYEVKKPVDDEDIIYTWINVQHGNLLYRIMCKPIVVHELINDGSSVNVGHITSTQKSVDKNSDDVETENCEASITKVNGAIEPVCRGKLIFNEDFADDTLNTNIWQAEVRLPSDSCEDEFVLYNTSNIAVESGNLRVRATLWNDQGTMDHEIRHDSLDLGDKCTENRRNYCKREPSGANIVPPVTSGRINTKSSFSFQYGRVLIKAKLPRGDWLYPLLLLEPTNVLVSDPYPCFQTRVAFARGNEHFYLQDNTNDIGGYQISGGPVRVPDTTVREQFLVNRTRSNEHFGADFHLYEMLWNKDYLNFKVDNEEYGSVRLADFSYDSGKKNMRGSAGPMDQKCSITLGLAAGGHADFPDIGNDKPWINTSPKAALKFWENRESWKSTWKSPELKVDYVRVYAI